MVVEFNTAYLTGMEISFLTAFFGGIVSFFAPCVVPLLPAYIGYITGVSFKELQKNPSKYRARLLFSSLFYILGFSAVFVMLGVTAGGIGQFLRLYSDWVRVAGGILIVILGMNLLIDDLFPKFGFLVSLGNTRTVLWLSKLRIGYLQGFAIGVIFATVWMPCVGYILGSILALAAVSQTALTGGLLLFVYSLGIALPFLMIAFTVGYTPFYLKRIMRYTALISKISGFLLIALGILLLTDTYKYVNGFVFNIAYSLGYKTR